jgi:hypothetical protein
MLFKMLTPSYSILRERLQVYKASPNLSRTTPVTSHLLEHAPPTNLATPHIILRKTLKQRLQLINKGSQQTPLSSQIEMSFKSTQSSAGVIFPDITAIASHYQILSDGDGNLGNAVIFIGI